MSENNDPQHDSSESSERWLVSYADFMTLLFAFFAVLYATSEVNLEKTKELEQSMRKYLIKVGAFGDSGERLDSGQKENTAIENPIQTYQKDNVKDDAKPDLKTVLLKEFNEEELSKKLVDMADEIGGYRLVIDSATLFADQSDKFNPKSLAFIDGIAKVIKKSESFVRIEHSYRTDKLSSQRFVSAWDLTSARSMAMARYMNSIHKIPERKIIGLAFGPQKDSELKDLQITGLTELIVTREPL